MEVNNRVQQYRIGNNLTVTELAEKMEVSRELIQEIEDGTTIPATHIVNKLCKVLKCKMQELFYL